MKNRILAILGIVLALAGLVAFSACKEETPKTETVLYTVTVSCEEGVPEGIKVRMQKGNETAAEKELSNGKAEFELEAGDYTATLTGVPEGYSFTSVTLTEEKRSAEIKLENAIKPEVYTYTVTVVCEDSLTGIRVEILKGGENVAEKELSNGKAEFELEAGDYTVTLTGIPEGYRYEEQTLTAEKRSAEIRIEKEPAPELATYEVTVSDTVSDVFGNTIKIPKQGIKVDLYEGDAIVGSAMTGADGVASFEVTEKEYTAQVGGVEGRVSFNEHRAEAEILMDYVLGTEEHPLEWKLGKNEVPLTENVLSTYESVYYVFTPEETGNYTFSADNYNKLILSEVFPEEGFMSDDGPITVALMKGTEYLFICSSTGYNGFGYTVTIEKGGSEKDPTVPTPWKGSGTKEDPFVIDTLEGDYEVLLKYENGDYMPVYFTYTAKEGGVYTVSSSDDEFFMEIGTEHYVSGGDQLFRTEADKTYILVLTPSEGTDSSLVVKFKIEEGWSGWLSPWMGSGKYDDPYVIKTLTGDYTVVSNIGGVYFRYTAEKDCDYTVTLTGDVSMEMSVREGAWNEKTNKQNITFPARDEKGGFTLENGKTYFFYVSVRDASAEPQDYTLNFSVAEGKFTPAEVPADGSEAHPFTLDPVFGEHTIDVQSASGVWYTFELEKDTKITVKAITSVFLTINGKQFIGSKADVEKEFTLGAGTVKLNIMGYAGATGEVKFSLTEVPTAEEGSKENPFVLKELLGTHSATVKYENDEFHHVYFTYEPSAEEELYTISSENYTDNYVISFSGARPIHSQVMTALNKDSRSIDLKVAKGTTFEIRVQELDEEETGTFTVEFKVEVYVAPPAALGSKENPEKLDSIEANSITVAASPTYYFEYTATQTGTYVVSSNCAYGTEISIRLKEDIDKVVERKVISQNETAILHFVEGKTYVLGFSPAETGEYGGGTFNFMIGFMRDDDAKEPDGTEAHPYLMKDLLGKHEIETTYTPGTWYVLTIEEEITVTVTANTKMMFTMGSERTWQATKEGATKDYTLTKGELKIHVQSFGGDGTVIFTVTDKNAPAPDKGSEQNPEILEDLLGTHMGNASYEEPYWYKVTLKENGYFTIKNNGTTTIRFENLGDTKFNINQGASSNIDLKAGEYTFKVMIYGSNNAADFNFTVEKFEAPEIPWKQGAGTEESPYVLETLEGKYSFAVSSPVYFTYTAKQDATFTFAPSTKLTLKIKKLGNVEKPVWKDTQSASFMYSATAASKPGEIELKAGDEFIFTAGNYSGTALTVISFEVTIATSSPTPQYTFVEAMIGSWSSSEGYVMTITADSFSLKNKGGTEETYTLKQSGPDRFGDYTNTLTWNNKEYSLSQTGAFEITLTSGDESIRFEKDMGTGSVKIDAIYAGTYVCAEVDEEEPVNVPNLVIKADGTIEWGGKTVVVKSGANGVYMLTVDGAAYELQILGGELNTMAVLVDKTTGTQYIFGTQAVQPDA